MSPVKKAIEDLAMFGGTPSFQAPLHVGRPNIGNRSVLRDRLDSMLDRRWFTNGGPYVEEFERRIADVLGVRHCVAMCNATIALEIAIRALGMDGEVIIPSFTFIATAHALQWQEIKPVFCDIDPSTHNIDPDLVEALVTPRTTGIIGVHVWGRACDVAALGAIARRHRLRLLFDAAHAFACSSHGHMIGSFGDAEVLSFHATKFLNSFEGGAVVTNDGALAERVALMRNFGFAGEDRVIYIGTNGKMNEAAAAMGLTSLESLEEFVAVNRRNYERYAHNLADVPGVELVKYDGKERYNYHHVVIELDERSAGLSRDLLKQLLHGENILARRYFYPGCHRMEPYETSFLHAGRSLRHTEAIAARVLSLPNGTAVASHDIEIVCNLIRFAVEHAGPIAARARALSATDAAS
jgi:dTDP-4-amino-4,6-dideoxygalactose transaminase